LVNFLVLIDKISKFTKNTIDRGRTPLDIYRICSIIREAFCCSYSIRKNNNLYIYFKSTQILIKFEGNSLRYLGPDERSQALLLKRALDIIDAVEILKTQRMKKSTPGIFVKKLLKGESILESIIDLYYDKILVIKEFEKESMESDIINLEELDNLREYCYIFSHNSHNTVDFLGPIDEKYKLKYANFSNIKGIENKILYINFLIDQKENTDKDLNR
jgi:tRNA pseudouridine-54 N-methylase